jgi:phosphate transport system substrate-binding protein
MQIKTIIQSILAAMIIITLGCQDQKPKGDIEIKGNPLVGSTEIWCDESLRKIISQQEDVFESAYKYAKVNIKYAPELDIKRMFYQDSLDVMIISHGIDSADIKAFHKRKVYPRQYRFGKSAIAFVGHKSRLKNTYTKQEMLDMMTNDKSGQKFAIENKKSAIANQLSSMNQNKPLGSNVYALKSKSEILDWLDKSPDGIGIIDWSEISDDDEAEAREWIGKVSVIKIAEDKNKEAYGPFQENLNGLYSFTRDLYFIRRLGLSDVSLGFATFICDQRGQKIMLKAGLLPEYQSERWIEFKGLTDVNVVE